MPRTPSRFRPANIAVLTIIVLGMLVGTYAPEQLTHAAPAPQAAAAPRVFLPLLTRAGSGAAQPTPAPATPTPPPAPTPSPAPTRTGFFALNDWMTYNAATVIDARGGVHLAMSLSDERHQDAPLNEPALYSYCPGPAAACADPTRWSEPVRFSTRVNEVQVAVTSDGRPRLLVRRHNGRYNDYEYYACDTGCTQAAAWSGISITEDTGNGLNDYTHGNHSFALDAQNRPRFVYGNGWGNGQPEGIYYAWCNAADCTQPGSWQRTRAMLTEEMVTLSGEGASLAFAGEKPRIVINRTISGLPTDLVYLSCDADCDQTASWASMVVTPPADRAWTSWDLEIDAAGHPRMALFDPAPIDIYTGGGLYYAACDADDCGRPEAWQRTLVAQGEGKNADLVIDARGTTHLVYDAGQRGVIGALRCERACTGAANWNRRILETNAQLMAEFAPAAPLSCGQQDVAWLDALPAASVGPAGELAVAYDTRFVARCFYVDPANPSQRIYTRIERIWWGVRWSTFAQS